MNTYRIDTTPAYEPATQERTANEKAPNYLLRRSLGGVAAAIVVAAGAFGIAKATSNDAPKEAFHPHTDSSEEFTLEAGDNIIDRALQVAHTHSDTPLTHEQVAEATNSAILADNRTEGTSSVSSQPGDILAVDFGEYDGDAELDIRVRYVNPVSSAPSEAGVPDYYSQK